MPLLDMEQGLCYEALVAAPSGAPFYMETLGMLDSFASWLAGPSVAYAMAPAGGGEQPSFLIQLAPFLMIFAIIYFIMIRPQQKRQQEVRRMQEALKPGDQVVANGILGEIARIKDDVVTLKVDENVRIRVQKSFVTSSSASANPDRTKASQKEKPEKQK